MIDASTPSSAQVSDSDKFPKAVMVWTGDHWVTQNVIESIKGDPKNPFPQLIEQGVVNNAQIIQTGSNVFVPNGATQFFAANYGTAMISVNSFVYCVAAALAIQWTNLNGFTNTGYTIQALTNAAGFIPAGNNFTIYWAAFGT